MGQIFYFYQYLMFFYTFLIVVSGLTLTIMAGIHLRNYKHKYGKNSNLDLADPTYLPGISIVAPAFNEEATIVANVKSLITVDYPIFEVIIINDGSKDKTLELLIEEYDLVETTYAYIEKIKTHPFKRIFKSRNPLYNRLIVADKENGGTKADASNAGINIAKYPYFLCTDVDCILSRDVLSRMIQPVLSSKKRVIAVGATMRMINSCEINENGVIQRVRPPRRIIPCFQELEYLRSYLISKMGWSYINTPPNVSGGLGLFDKEVVIDAGGYDPISHAEDMDLMIRMSTYMRDLNEKYSIDHIPITACWTEGPPNLHVLNNQRTRWGRGLLQVFIVHRKLLFNYKYGKLGLLTLPFIFFFEFLASIIEASGLIVILYLIISNRLNYETVFVMLGFIYIFAVFISLMAVIFDIISNKLYKHLGEYLKLILFSIVEVLIYHPFIVIFSIKGYINFLFKQKFEWGAMKRQGFETVKTEQPETIQE